MSIKTAPTTIGFESITFRAVNAIATSQSPFTFKQQMIRHAGQAWEADVSIPPVRRELAEPWIAFLLSLRGSENSFLLSDPNCSAPRGTAVDGDIVATGTKGADSVTLTLSNAATLKAGDYIQLGTLGNTKLHKVLEDISSTGVVEVWPALRKAYANEAVYVAPASGLFRLSGNTQEWQVGSSSTYGISFMAVEVIQ